MLAKGKVFRSYKDWIWRKKGGVIFIQSNLLLSHGFNHAFFTKRSLIRNEPEELNKILSSNFTVHYSKQIHGDKVLPASQTHPNSTAEADSIISDKSFQSLWIYTADCIPILIGDKGNGVVAAVHSGWKGLTKNIIKRTIEKLCCNGCKKDKLIIVLGPAISINNYTVNLDIIKLIYKSLNKNKNILDDEIIRVLETNKCIKTDDKSGEVFLDIRKVAKVQLSEMGIKKSQFSISSDCTFSKDLFFESWRRDKSKKRQWSFIASKA